MQQMRPYTLIALFISILNVKCLSGGLVVHPCDPPTATVEASPPIYPIIGGVQTEEPRYYIPELVCQGLIKPIQIQDQWVLGIDSQKFNPWLFFDNEMDARACSVYFPGPELRKWRPGCCWIKG